MVTVARSVTSPRATPALREMFEARKRVFVDLLHWNVPVLDQLFEIDEFDTAQAVYLIVSDERGRHSGSARLLPTDRPHILGRLFPELCAAPVPTGEDIFEITRFCLDPREPARKRLETRNRLVSGLVDHALENGIAAYTGVAELGWLQQILAFGWTCRPLGLPRSVGGKLLGALRIDVTNETPRLLEDNGIYRPGPLERLELLEAA